MYTVNNIADWFLSRVDRDKGDTISPLKLQKLVYYAQAWNLALFGEPLFIEPVQAWASGPVVYSLYTRFSSTRKYSAIDLEACIIDPPVFDERTEDLLNDILEVYGEHSASYLEQLTHKEQPWIIARGDKKPYERCNSEITHQSMIEYYSKLNEQQETPQS